MYLIKKGLHPLQPFFYLYDLVLIEIIQSHFIVGIEGAVVARSDAGEHPGLGCLGCIRGGSGDVDSSSAAAFPHRSASATNGTVKIIRVTETDAMADFMCQYGRDGAEWLRTQQGQVDGNITVRSATGRKSGRSQISG